MKAIAAVALTLSMASARPPRFRETYESFLSEFPEHPGSREAFEANLRKIRAHNADNSKTWKMGVNKFTALTSDEFRKATKGRSKGVRPATLHAEVSNHVSVADLPRSVDWRTKGVVTPVKNQEMCGGCWGFAVTEAIESAVAIATGKLMVLAQQQVLDCTPNPQQCGGQGGCNGATQELGFQYVSTSPGLSLDSSYPWTGTSTYPNCQRQQLAPVATISGFAVLPFNNYSALMNSLASFGPVTISADATAWQTYESGVFNDANCGTDVDHAIVMEGYGTDPTTGLDYYLVRNSWSASWGEQGYIRVARYGSTPQGEPCGIDNSPLDGDGCPGGPGSIPVCGLCGLLSDSSFPIGAKLAA